MNIKSVSVSIAVLVVTTLIAGVFMDGMAKAQDESALLGKIEEILKGQKAIADDIAVIKSELGIIKIRITQQQ
jgi:hypothetical protein